ncbi:TPA: LPXTG cell wall anchor domain-containing protein [Streptococcus agalactiae]|nr:LPXTG cell wall anchor domain-containing protein [Streptococcus agalactiae]HEO6603635.1 LPXTG cell wall anchor domain-containing protein [Streptococcus agalactiae]HEO6607319.1 LPXTG cell wall anchor domain-containing protein [Streptococcus agalactiae]HEO6615481.1 LPXTG cell wall anchor domain-containing protein [Streptococcus agalactiae]HEO6640889.1 LPXTG cell wall anchor domain-containing protein [Streptococcus agalactiae]
MFKKQLYATLLLSSALLSVSTLTSADETTTPTDPTTAPVVVTPTEPTQPVDVPVEPTPAPTPEAPVDTTTPVETPTETPAPAPTDPTTAPSTEESSQPEVTPEAPKTEETPDTTEPATEKPVSQPEISKPEQPTEGQVSPSTGQVVSTVSSEAPVETATGVSIVSTKEGKVVLSDGSEVAPETIGGKTNEDQTITVTKNDGSKVTLPHTGEAKTLGLSLLGALMALTGALVWKQKKSKTTKTINAY